MARLGRQMHKRPHGARNDRLGISGGSQGIIIRTPARRVNFFREIKAWDDLTNNDATRTALLGIGSRPTAGITPCRAARNGWPCSTRTVNASAAVRTKRLQNMPWLEPS